MNTPLLILFYKCNLNVSILQHIVSSVEKEQDGDIINSEEVAVAVELTSAKEEREIHDDIVGLKETHRGDRDNAP